MEDIQRKSPVRFNREPVQKEIRDGWEVAISYGTEKGPFLIDLSHRSKWDFQDSDLSRCKPFGLTVPDAPGQCLYKKGLIINRMNRTQCAIWHLAGKRPDPPQEPAYTETTDGHALMAITGEHALRVMEQITNLDLGAPSLAPPCLVQGPLLHIPCQVVLFSRENDEATILFSFSRGYGQGMAEALLHSGKTEGLVPGGELNLPIVP